jgi:hypothetical protein
MYRSYRQRPSGPDPFFAGLAFLAGFNERILKDVLGNAAGSVAEIPTALYYQRPTEKVQRRGVESFS